MIRFLFAVIVLISLRAQAAPVVAIGANVAFRLATNGREYEAQAPLAVRAGYRFSFAELLGEYSYVRSSSGTDMVWSRKQTTNS